MSDLENRCLLITGGASGMGRATAVMAARRGADVLLADMNADGLAEAAAEIQALGRRAETMVVDVRDVDQLQQMAPTALERLGRLDGAVFAAGIVIVWPALEGTLDQLLTQLSVNLVGTIMGMQSAAQVMVREGTQGSIVTFSSTVPVAGWPKNAAYAATKGGVIGATKCFAIDLGEYGIRVNSVAPGVVDTPLTRNPTSLARRPEVVARTPLGRIGEVDDVASAVCFLLSDDSGFITGQTLHVNGGWLMP